MKTSLNLDAKVLHRAARLTGIKGEAALVRMGLLALIATASAKRLAELGGTEPALRLARRRRQ